MIAHCKPVQNSESANGKCSQNFVADCVLSNSSFFDTVDNPTLKKLIGKSLESEENTLKEMKYECNRLDSFKNNGPANKISPRSLASAGFFYLQHEDGVQCPFCWVIVYNWTSIDKPLREHIKKNPKCPFLMGSDVGNIPLIPRHQQKSLVNTVLEKQFSSSTNVHYKPKHPKMVNTERRRQTYKKWQLTSIHPQQLAECGLFYSGIADVVVCFFCGGSLGNWESHDEPWVEHAKYFPNCAFLSVNKSENTKSSNIVGSCGIKSMKLKSSSSHQLPSKGITEEVIKEALNIFPKHEVLDAIKKKNRLIFSLQELCDDILQLNEEKKTESNSLVIQKKPPETVIENNSSISPDVLLCKICMNNERGAVFQPCGHLVSCWNCSQLISDCPVCRKPIISAIRTYYS